MKRRTSRECALQLLFQYDFTKKIPDKKELEDFWSMRIEAEDIRTFAEELLYGTLKHIKEIDDIISSVSEHWTVERMAAVDRNILRLATYELLYRPDIPAPVTINEAIEIAKRYSSEDSPSFINGILDRIAREVASRVELTKKT
ncbi:MAG: transcription antitermination factor NusB [Thermodesulfovibrionales bacterium]|nr:transcription antitermination factor NusB [Thermodesulfovibrionales bacterium]